MSNIILQKKSNCMYRSFINTTTPTCEYEAVSASFLELVTICWGESGMTVKDADVIRVKWRVFLLHFIFYGSKDFYNAISQNITTNIIKLCQIWLLTTMKQYKWHYLLGSINISELLTVFIAAVWFRFLNPSPFFLFHFLISAVRVLYSLGFALQGGILT